MFSPEAPGAHFSLRNSSRLSKISYLIYSLLKSLKKNFVFHDFNAKTSFVKNNIFNFFLMLLYFIMPISKSRNPIIKYIPFVIVA